MVYINPNIPVEGYAHFATVSNLGSDSSYSNEPELAGTRADGDEVGWERVAKSIFTRNGSYLPVEDAVPRRSYSPDMGAKEKR